MATSRLVKIGGSVINAKWTPGGSLVLPPVVADPVSVLTPAVVQGSLAITPAKVTASATVRTPTLQLSASVINPATVADPSAVPAASISTAQGDVIPFSPAGYTGRQTVGADAGTVSTGLISPTAETLIIVFAAASNSPGGVPLDTPPGGGMTGLGLTWTKVANITYATRRKMYCWWSVTGPSVPTPGAISIPYAGGSGIIQDIGWSVIELRGASINTSILDQPMGPVTTSVLGSGTSISVTLAGGSEAGGGSLSAVALEDTSTIVAEHDLLADTDFTTGDNFRQLAVQWTPHAASDLTPAFSWSSADGAAEIAFLIYPGSGSRTITPAVVADPAVVRTPAMELPNSPQTINPAKVTDAAAVLTPSVTLPSDYPNASNTGYSGSLTTHSGDLNTTSNGQLIQNTRVSGGRINVQHNNVTIRNCLVVNPGGLAIRQEPGITGMLIEDCEFDGTGNGSSDSSVAFGSYTMRRCNIHNFGEGAAAYGNVLIEDCYFHDFTNFIAAGAHQDGIQVEESNDVIIRHNTIIMAVDGANGNIHVSSNCFDVLVEDNLLASRGGNDMSIGGPGSVWRNNKISVLLAGYLTAYPDGDTGPQPHITRQGSGGTFCGTTYYDTNLAAWNDPTAGQYVERSITNSTTFVRDSAC